MTIVAYIAAVTAQCFAVARADEIKVLAARVLRPVLTEIGPAFQKVGDHTLDIIYEPAGAVTNRVDRGEATDVVIVQKPSLLALAATGRISLESVKPIALSGVSIGVLKGEPKPEIGSIEEFTKALLDAKSVAYPDPDIGNASGIHFVSVIKRLGIEDRIRQKVIVWKEPFPDFARTSNAQLAITQAMDILSAPRYELLGPLPAALQDFEAFTWAAGVSATARNPAGARAFIQFLVSPLAAAVIRKRGMEPAQ